METAGIKLLYILLILFMCYYMLAIYKPLEKMGNSKL